MWKFRKDRKAELDIPIEGISEYLVPKYFVLSKESPLIDWNDFIIHAPVVDETDVRGFDQ